MGDTGERFLMKTWGVYRADGGLWGELRYVAGKLAGTAHCALCDVTHGWTGKKGAFRDLERRLDVPIALVHENERDAELEDFTRGRTPCVVAEFGPAPRRFSMLLDADALDELSGDVDAFEASMREALAAVDTGP